MARLGTEGGKQLKRTFAWALWIVGGLFASTIVAALDPRGALLSGLPGYLVLGGVCGLLAWLAWRAVASRDAPPALALAFGLALALRLGVGIGLAHALPRFGYDREVQQAGYVFQDAWLRDGDAWALGRSDQPLTQAFLEPRASDQYGGLLFLSAGIYRTLSGGFHQPLMVVLLTATMGSLAVLFTWAFAAMVFGNRAGLLAGWIAALYPDAVLLGASQMREPFIVAGLALGMLGCAWVRVGSMRRGLRTLLLGVLLALLVSPPSGLGILALAGLAWLWEGGRSGERSYRVLGGLAAAAAIALILTVAAWSAVGGVAGDHPLGAVGRWLSEGAQYQLVLLERGSGWVQKLFHAAPEWAHMPMATVYGLARPLLPAALADRSGAVLWQVIEIWRAIGWFALLPILLYAPLAGLRAREGRAFSLYLSLAVWLAAILASYRAAGDDWDNPRYRAALIPLMGALAGWAWRHSRRTASPWLGRTIVAFLGATLIFTHWFVGRYYQTPRMSLEATLAVMAGFAGLYIGAAALWDAQKSAAKRRLTTQTPEV